MKRDKNLLRELLLELEASLDGTVPRLLPLSFVEGEAALDEEVAKRNHHLALLADEGLVLPEKNGFRMTALGHDAVEAIGASSVWDDVKDAAPKEAYSIVKDLGSSLATSALSKLMGWG